MSKKKNSKLFKSHSEWMRSDDSEYARLPEEERDYLRNFDSLWAAGYSKKKTKGWSKEKKRESYTRNNHQNVDALNCATVEYDIRAHESLTLANAVPTREPEPTSGACRECGKEFPFDSHSSKAVRKHSHVVGKQFCSVKCFKKENSPEARAARVKAYLQKQTLKKS